MRTLRSRQALVTGAASGIGRAVSIALAREGTHLWLVDIDGDGLRETQALIAAAAADVNVITHVCDLSDAAAIDTLIAAVRERWGAPHILINNAGVAHYGSTRHMTMQQWRHILAVNLHAPIQLIHAFLPAMLGLEEGHIVNMSSIFGLASYRRIAAYQATKFGLVGLGQSLRVELAGTSVGVSTICPGFVSDTALNRNKTVADPAHRQRFPHPWLCGSAAQVAGATVKAIRRNRGLVVITPMARAMWWWQRHFPRFTDWFWRTVWGFGKRRRAMRRKRQIERVAAGGAPAK